MFKVLAATALLSASIAGAPSVEARTQSHRAICNVTYINEYRQTVSDRGYGSIVFNYGTTTTLTVTAPRLGLLTFRDTNNGRGYADQNGNLWSIIHTGNAALIGNSGDYSFLCQAVA